MPQGAFLFKKATTFRFALFYATGGDFMTYNRKRAVKYAHNWAYARNPVYPDFSSMGGDCTNFISQCLHEGGAAMNYTPVMGWFCINLGKRAPAWSGVEELYRFLITNDGRGPYAVLAELTAMQPGDLVQLSFNGTAYSHSLLVVSVGKTPTIQNILVATHSIDRDYHPLNSWKNVTYRYIHIVGIR
jgi:hypothetical protein